MITIYKYQIPILHTTNIEMPQHSKIISFQVQDETPTIWCIVDTKEPKVDRFFSIHGTGGEIKTSINNYIGTIQLGGYVWHLFEN